MCIFHYIVCKYFHIKTINLKSVHKCERKEGYMRGIGGW